MQPTILLDSNLAVLLCMGMTGEQNISRHKRLGSFDVTDYRLLVAVLGNARGLVICPNIATETSNLVRQSYESLRDAGARALRELLDSAEERQVGSRTVASDEAYMRLGLTDAAMLQILSDAPDTSLLTTDFALYQIALGRGLNAQNFNYFRDQRADFR
jgi:hypothetical protein